MTFTRDDRIRELTTRQVFYGSSMVCKLNAIKGKWYYTVSAWLDNKDVDSKIVVLYNKYNGEDPDELFQLALLELGIKKIKLGVPKQ